ncbi:sugar transferase [Paenibacillus daejeonensis]|uniref:sugar transferase n=1 Tax=Paenibacillus daejeonensis TaxID=135193 RepID=UPI0003708B12|nr:sugar transferase [Paenibacillus daejeonensis]
MSLPTPTQEPELVTAESNRYYPLAGSAQSLERRNYLLLKRCIDILGSLGGLLILSPLIIVVAVLIKLEDPRGRVFYHQTRIGKDEKPFRMYKLRSMVSNADQLLEQLRSHNEVSGAMFKMKQDPRVTRIGRLIRRTSIDELPQLWNVLRGEMSLVGPRPPLPSEVESYTAFEKRRLSVVPGCTGLWQVSGRSTIGFKEMVDLDLEYIRVRSTMYDLKIMFRTVRVMLGAKDAY